MTTDDSRRSTVRISSLQRLVEARFANPLLRRLLRSPLHWPASRSLVLVSYVGPRSGRRYTFPVVYARVDERLVVVTPGRESRWWRNFRRPRACSVWFRGEERPATGTVVSGDERKQLLGAYGDEHPRFGRRLGVGSREEPETAAEELVVVRFAFDDS
ncbi:nitroreductase/quinone reductase family protein [Halogeometricum limi]|uniref:Deazaflavin-dependent oxidoreductase, nitroreductase family n=1 Tax=Halogeometricum limi TaxID=555875 RepID=A0A1I6FQM8_9EURY|nr:nitroreductase/quinone reductase family protein [Halogeometricum limi]SFR32253.1 deazaflavin-dependent oxidoreductase, nitroreductase family [Halogeometricum limi]